MVLGWRRAFCTSIPPDPDTKQVNDNQEQSNPSPRFGSKFGFFSNPSTPRLPSQPVSSHGLRCRTTATVSVSSSSAPVTPKLQCKTGNSPRLFSASNSSSPRSPSAFSLLKSGLRLTKNRCGICLQSAKTGQGMAIFTAECSHSFHFPCISSHMKKQSSSLMCPVCSVKWKEMPLLSARSNLKPTVEPNQIQSASRSDVKPKNQYSVILKVYNDDEPLMSPTTRARFNPIPESDEENDHGGEFQGFFVCGNSNPIVEPAVNMRKIDFKLSPEVAVVSVGRSYETYAISLKVTAPPAQARSANRAPIDLVAVLDVSGCMSNVKLQMMKRAMRLVISSLSTSDRLSIIAFSTNSKRLLPLRRMTSDGRRAARRIIEAIALLDGSSTSGDALKKAVKVLEDRRERNDVASIMLFSDDKDKQGDQNQQSSFVSSTRYSQDIPVHCIGFNQNGACGQSQSEDSFAKSVSGLISVVVRDFRLCLGFVSGSAPAEIAAVYSYSGRPVLLGSGLIRIGDLYAEEERELLVELKVPSSAIGSQHIISVRSSYRDPSTQQVSNGKDESLIVPKSSTVRSTTPSIQRLRDLFVTTRAVAESRRLIERNDASGAERMLSSARALLLQSNSDSALAHANGLEAELSELRRWRLNRNQYPSNNNRSRTPPPERELIYVDEKGEPLTPTSAWKAAERLAKVAMMRKSLNRVSDLHGFEDARF